MSIELEIQNADVIVVGSGFFGLTVAERLANLCQKRVLIIEKRGEIGGNSASYFDRDTNIEVHKYGSHLFHTNNQKVIQYVKLFTDFNSYRHKVYSKHDDRYFPIPINLLTISMFAQRAFTPKEAADWIIDQIPEQMNSEESLESNAISQIGKNLYEALIAGYTKKQWETNPRDLPSGIIKRLPVRFNFDNSYFNDNFQGLPLNGYCNWHNKMVENPLIKVRLNTDYFSLRNEIPPNKVIVYTGPIDKFHNFTFGPLSWRTLDFDFEKIPLSDFQGCAVINYADAEIPWTRIHEFKHLHPERVYSEESTIIAREFSRFANLEDEPYYPINSNIDRKKLLNYRSLNRNFPNVYFGGRLGTYQYLDMHMAIASALNMFESELNERLGTN